MNLKNHHPFIPFGHYLMQSDHYLFISFVRALLDSRSVLFTHLYRLRNNFKSSLPFIPMLDYHYTHSFLSGHYLMPKLCKIGFKTDDLCSFCEAQPETLHHLLFHCVYARHLWNEFQIYWHQLSNQHIQITLKDVLFGIISYPCPLLNLLNYFLIIGKRFCGTAGDVKPDQKFKDFKPRSPLNMKLNEK